MSHPTAPGGVGSPGEGRLLHLLCILENAPTDVSTTAWDKLYYFIFPSLILFTLKRIPQEQVSV